MYRYRWQLFTFYVRPNVNNRVTLWKKIHENAAKI